MPARAADSTQSYAAIDRVTANQIRKDVRVVLAPQITSLLPSQGNFHSPIKRRENGRLNSGGPPHGCGRRSPLMGSPEGELPTQLSSGDRLPRQELIKFLEIFNMGIFPSSNPAPSINLTSFVVWLIGKPTPRGGGLNLGILVDTGLKCNFP